MNSEPLDWYLDQQDKDHEEYLKSKEFLDDMAEMEQELKEVIFCPDCSPSTSITCGIFSDGVSICSTCGGRGWLYKDELRDNLDGTDCRSER